MNRVHERGAIRGRRVPHGRGDEPVFTEAAGAGNGLTCENRASPRPYRGAIPPVYSTALLLRPRDDLSRRPCPAQPYNAAETGHGLLAIDVSIQRDTQGK